MIKYLDLEGTPIKLFYPNKRIEQVLIGVHGFTSSKESSTFTYIGEKLIESNILFITFDLPNHGNNNKEVPLSLEKCLQTLKLIEEYAFFFSDKVSIFASSFGAYLTLLHLQEDREIEFKNIILRAPAVYMDEIFLNEIMKNNQNSLEELKTLDYLLFADTIKINYNFYEELISHRLDKLPERKTFINIFQGDQDELIDLKKNENYFKKNFPSNYKLYYFEGAKHSFKKETDKEKLWGLLKVILLG